MANIASESKTVPEVCIVSLHPELNSVESTSSSRDAEPQRPDSAGIGPTDSMPVAPVGDTLLGGTPPSASEVRFKGEHENHDKHRQAQEVRIITPNARHTLKPFVLLLAFWASGVAFSVGHVIYYWQQDGTIVGSPWEQENKIRVGTALAFLSQVALGTAVWGVYTQMVWITNLADSENDTQNQGPPFLTMGTLNKIFNADRSVRWFLSIAMLRTFTAGYMIALFAWLLILPGFFTPGTLFVYDDSVSEIRPMMVPYLTIANSSRGHNYSYSPDYYGDLPENKKNVTKDFNGPRTIITRLTTATSGGQMLAIKSPQNVSSYTVNFYGPTVRCTEADAHTISIIDSILARRMDETWRGAKANKTAYYAFVPSYDEEGNMTPLDTVRYQTSTNATNEIWLSFERYNLSEPGCESHMHYQVCRLFNSTYDLDLEWHNGFQNITGSATLVSHDPVPYPIDKPPAISNMVQHAYSSLFWALADQVTGSVVWYEEVSATNNTSRPRKLFGGIQSPIQHNVLLGSSDLNVFFDLNEDPGSCRADETSHDRQRQQDIDLARGRTLAELIEEMSFNMTVSLMHNDLLTRNVSRDVTIRTAVNRYGYSKLGLLIPYGLACGLTTCAVILGLVLMLHYDPMPDRDVQDILAAMDPEVLRIAREPDAHRHFRFRVVHRGHRGQRRPSFVVAVEPGGKGGGGSRERPEGGGDQGRWRRWTMV